MRQRPSIGAALLALGVAGLACSSSNSGSGGSSGSVTPSPFQGTWSCAVQETLTFTAPIGAAPQASSFDETLAIVTRADGSIASTASTDAGSTCAIDFTTSADTAAIESGQQCSAGGISALYTDGTLTLNGSSLTGSVSYTFTGSVESADASTSVVGTGTSTYTCTNAS